MSVSFDITDHVVERYVKRHAVGSTNAQARAYLESLLLDAVPLKERTINGDALWRVADPPTLFVVKPDGGKQVVVTVLPAGTGPRDGINVEDVLGAEADEVVAAYERVRPLLESKHSAPTKRDRDKDRERVLAETCSHLRQLEAALLRKLTGLQKQHDEQIAAWERKYQRQVEHAQRQKSERDAFRRALQRALRGDVDGARRLLGEIEKSKDEIP